MNQREFEHRESFRPRITLIPADIYRGPIGPELNASLSGLYHYFVYDRNVSALPIVHVTVSDHIVLTMRARYVAHVLRILRLLCYNCNFPPMNCYCPQFLLRTGEWELYGPNGEHVYMDVSRYGRKHKYIIAKYEGTTLQGTLITKPKRSFGFGIYRFRVIVDGFLALTFYVNNQHEVRQILDRLCMTCYQFESKCHCVVFHARCGSWQLEFYEKNGVDMCNAYYTELQGDSDEEELPHVAPNPMNLWGGVRVWERDTGSDVFRDIINEIGMYPMRIVDSFLGWEYPDISRLLTIMEEEEPPKNSRRSKWTVLQSGHSTTISEILGNDELYFLGAKLLEDIATLVYYMRNGRTLEDIAVAITAFVRSVTGQSITVLIARFQRLMYEELAQYFLLQDENNWANQFAELFENYKTVKKSMFANKVLKVLNTTVFGVILHKLNIEPDGDLVRRIEQTKLRPSLLNCVTFMDALSDLVSFCLKQGRQYVLTGDLSVFFMDSDSISDWYLRAKKLADNFKFLSNPDAVGIKIHDYLSDLDKAIIDGRSIVKYMKSTSLEYKLIVGHLSRLETINKEYLTICAAQSLRRQPLGIVLYGKPGVGKSHLLEAIYHYHSKLRGLDASPGFKFQFNSDEDYMTNYKSYMHCIVIDDVAQHRADKVQGIDKSLGMCIKLINNQPTCPPQAAIEDKGKTPVLSELVIATTNTMDLGIPYYFSKSYAVMRRFKVHIEMVLKEQFASRTGGISGEFKDVYDDKWDFVIRRPVEQEEMVGRFVIETTLHSFTELFDYLKPIIEDHHRQQDKFLESAANFHSIELCTKCSLPEAICEKVGNCEFANFDFDFFCRPQGDTIDPEMPQLIPLESNGDNDGDSTNSGVNGDTTEDESYIGADAMDEDPYVVKAPWRVMPLEIVGPRRFMTERIAVKFIQFMIRDDPNNRGMERITTEYAYVHYPIMMSCGYPNEEIFRDYRKYLAWRFNQEDLERLTDTISNIDAGPWWRVKLSQVAMYLYFELRIVRYIVDVMLSYSMSGRLITWSMGYILRSQRQRKEWMERIGAKLDRTFGGEHPFVKIMYFWSFVSTMGLFYQFYKSATKSPKEDHTFFHMDEANAVFREAEKKYKDKAEYYRHYYDKQAQECEEKSKYYGRAREVTDEMLEQLASQTCDKGAKQGLLQQIGTLPTPAPGDEKVNIWVGTESTVTSLDFCTDRATTLDAFRKALFQSCVQVEITWASLQGIKQYKGRALILSNECILINNHGLPTSSFSLKIKWSSVRGKIYTHVECLIQQNQIFRIVNRDVAIINTKSLPPFVSNFTKNFVKCSFDGRYDGYYMVRQDDGSFLQHPVYGITKVNYCERVGSYDFNCVTFRGTVKEPTLDGYCGSPLIADTGYGPIVLGFHFLYRSCDHRVFASALFVEDFKFITTGVQGTKVDIGDYHVVKKHKSFLDFHEEGAITYLGEIDYRVRYKTSVKPTEIKDHLVNMGSFGDFSFRDEFSKPLMHNYIPQQRSLKEYLSPSYGIDETLIKKCADVIIKDILTHLPKSELDLIQICTYEVALNGMPGMAYVDSMKRSTSMGFPWHCTKRKYLQKCDSERWPEGVKFSPEIESRIEEMLESYMKGERTHPVFSTNLKDEVVTKKKYDIGKTRTFFSCPADYLVVMRIFFLGFSRVVQRNWKLFHNVIGVNCHSTQWQEVYNILVRYGLDRTVAGDFAGFDKKFHMLFSRWAFYIIRQICMASGNFEGMERVLDALGADFVHPAVNFFGMMIVLLSGEVSGHQLTTIFNCFCSLLYIMYAYSKLYDVETFFAFVAILVLGDDNIMSISPERPLFNHTSIQSVLNDIGVGYTMAEKEAASVPYIHIEDSTFLKRTFRYSSELGYVVGPLEKQSIAKMLTYQVSSKTCSRSDQLSQAMVSASIEAFYHGKMFFEYINNILDTVPKSDALQVSEQVFPRFTWEENVERFLKASGAAEVTRRNQKCNSSDSYCRNCSHASMQDLRMDPRIKSTRAFPKVSFKRKIRLISTSEATVWQNEFNANPDNHQLSMTNEELNNQQPIAPDTAGNETNQQEQTYFVHEAEGEIQDLTTPLDPTPEAQRLIPDLKSFMSRPARIWSYIWDIGEANGTLDTFYPWKLYFNLAAIKNKLESFPLLRCNLHLKFVINASPFYYGSIGAFYIPLYNDLGDKSGYYSGYTTGERVLRSQRNKVWLDPQSVSTAEMVLPFLHYQNWEETYELDLFQNLGAIDLVQFVGLLSANGVAAGKVSINCYAWASELEVAGTTSRAILQGKTEYKTGGQVSSAASTVKSVASKLKNVPVLGPFASATETVSDVVGSVASFFGFSNVPVIDDVKPFKSVPFHTLASSEISEPINKLSLQPKQETAVGMYHGDAGADPLVISNFVQRESFLCGTLWSTTGIENDVLFTAAVQPEQFEYGGTMPAWFPTPMAFMATLFQYWRGDIIFRFKIIKSKYHRGRLNITWDQAVAAANNMPSVGDPSVFNVIVDLDEQDEVEVRVPYCQAAPFLRTWELGTSTFWSNGPAPAFANTGNGIIQVRVLNPLTAPVASSSVNLLVFVRGAENLEFAGPKNMPREKSLVKLQGEVITINQSSGDDTNLYKEVFGEKIISLRELMHRQSRAWTQIIPKNADWAGNQMIFSMPIQRLPRVYGFAASGWEFAVSALAPPAEVPFNFVRNHPVLWITSCFVGYKGSVNYNFNPLNIDGKNTHEICSAAVARRSATTVASMAPRAYSTNATNSTSQLMRNLNTNANIDMQGAAGMALTNQFTQAGLAANLPYYHEYKFLVANLDNIGDNETNDNSQYDTFEFSMKRGVPTASTTDADVLVDVLFGTGPDYEVIYFINCPPIYQCTVPTARATG